MSAMDSESALGDSSELSPLGPTLYSEAPLHEQCNDSNKPLNVPWIQVQGHLEKMRCGQTSPEVENGVESRMHRMTARWRCTAEKPRCA